MQQTTKYKLDLIEKDDVFSPDALNQNMEKVEEALAAETAARAAETAARQEADAALDARVTALEVHKMVVGTYVGNDKTFQFVPLNFTPVLVIAQFTHSLSSVSIPGHPIAGVEIVEGGFNAFRSNSGSMNASGTTYNFAAFA